MERLRRVIIEEIALEGPSGIEWVKMPELLSGRKSDLGGVVVTDEVLNEVRDYLQYNDIIESTRKGFFRLAEEEMRFQILGVSQLPLISENMQAMRILEIVSKGRQRGTWSFNLCVALKVDPKQLFHLSNILVEFGLIHRFSNVPIPRQFKSQTTATNASFFIHSKFSGNSLDPDIADVIDPIHSTENVCSLILALLKEAGGVMITTAVRNAVVIDGAFTGKQFKRGRDRLLATRRIESLLVPRSDSYEEDYEEDEDDIEFDEKSVTTKFIHALKLVEDYEKPTDGIKTSPQQSSDVKEEDDMTGTPPESDEEPASIDDESLRRTILARNLLRSSLGFKDSVVQIIKSSGSTGVTTRDISRLTGIGVKEVLKTMETVRLSDEIEQIWKNDGKRKYIVFRWNHLVIKTDEPDAFPASPQPSPLTSKGYVTDQTMQRTVLALDIVTSRVALSLIDLGRAIEARELADGTGVPGSQIDRRTLKKICEIAKIPLVEKGESSNTKIIIAYDSTQLSREEALTRVDRPVGMTPKGETGTMSLKSTPTSSPSTATKKFSIHELLSKGRLAALAVFGKAGTPIRSVSMQVAELYGFIRSSDIFKAKLVHQFLVAEFSGNGELQLSEIIEKMPLLLYLQVIGCGVNNSFIDDFFGSKTATIDIRMEQLSPELISHLASSVPVSSGTGSQVTQLSRAMAPLAKLGLLSIRKIDVDRVAYSLKKNGRIALPSDSGENQVDADILFSSSEAVDEYWATLFRVCMSWRNKYGISKIPKNYSTLAQLFKRQQWKSRMIVTLSQRRELESLLRLFVYRADRSTGPTVIDGSNEDLVRVCSNANIDSGVALKVLRQLLALSQPANQVLSDSSRQKLILAKVNQARFHCQHCNQLFFQLSSIKRHIETVHNADVPTDETAFTRSEYLDAIERLRSKIMRSEGMSGQKRNPRRRRRNRGDKKSKIPDSLVAIEEASKYTKAFMLACSLLRCSGTINSSPDNVTDVEGIDSDHLIWKVTAQISGDESGEIARLKCISAMRTNKAAAPQVPILTIDSSAPGPSTKVQTLANVLIMNKLGENDFIQVEEICRANNVEYADVSAALRDMHARGLLAIERRIKSSMVSASNTGLKKAFCPSKYLKLSLFGKYVDIFKFSKMVRFEIFRFRDQNDLIIDAEPDHDSVISFSVLDRLAAVEDKAQLLVDWEEALGIEPTLDMITEAVDENEFTGIKKHLELTRDSAAGASIEGIDMIPTPYSRSDDAFRRNFVVELLQLGSCAASHVWKPFSGALKGEDCDMDLMHQFSEIGLDWKEIPIDVSSESLNAVLAFGKTNQRFSSSDSVPGLSPTISAECIRVLLEVQLLHQASGEIHFHNNRSVPVVEGRRPAKFEITPFLALVFKASRKMYFSHCPVDELEHVWNKLGIVSELRPNDFETPLALWTSIDGDLKEQVLADLFLRVLEMIYSHPGIRLNTIKKHLVILSSGEIEILLEILANAGLVSKSDGGALYLRQISQW